MAADSDMALLLWALGGVCCAFALFCVLVIVTGPRGAHPLVTPRERGARPPAKESGARPAAFTRLRLWWRRQQSWRRARERELGLRNGRLR